MGSSIRWGAVAALVAALVVGCGGSTDSGGLASGMSSSPIEKSVEAAALPTIGATGQSTVQQQFVAPASMPTPLPAADVIEPKISDGGLGREVDPFKDIEIQVRPTAGVISLSELTVTTAQSIQKSATANERLPLKVGVPRRVPATADQNNTKAVLSWHGGAGGARIAALRFLSPGAKGVRLGVLVSTLPFGAKLRFYADDAKKLFEVSGFDVLTTIQRNTEAGDLSDAARLYWSPNLGGEAVTMEIEVPSQADTQTVSIAIPVLSHATMDIRKLDSILKIGESASCNLDVPCTSAHNQLSQSVALMDFVGDGTGGTTSGDSYVCTGTLLNDRMSTGTPWFLTAKHCISNQTMASTLYTLWFYRSSSCNSGGVSPGAQVLTTGATLLYVSPDVAPGQALQGDTSFMRLNSTPPSGAMYAGSSSYSVSTATSIYGVHHPKGDVQKYSTGIALGAADCTAATCGPSVSSNSRFLRVRWSSGTTEGGSSGSGLFTKMNGKDYLVGHLLGGAASCTNPAGADYYGRFDSIASALAPWLSAASTTTRLPVFRMYNTRDRNHFYTSDPVERDYLLTKYSIFNFEGIGFYAYGATAPGTSPVHRFYNTSTGAHFFTINEQERQNVQANFAPPFTYDGVAWSAGTTPLSGAAPMYRLYNRVTKTHFYTISEAERAYVQQNFAAEFQLDGIAYYAWAP